MYVVVVVVAVAAAVVLKKKKKSVLHSQAEYKTDVAPPPHPPTPPIPTHPHPAFIQCTSGSRTGRPSGARESAPSSLFFTGFIVSIFVDLAGRAGSEHKAKHASSKDLSNASNLLPQQGICTTSHYSDE